MKSWTTHGRRQRVRAGLIVLGIVAAMLVPASAGATAAKPALASCQAGNMSLSLLVNAGSEAAGSTFVDVGTRNLGRTSCSLKGHPGVSGYAGHQIGAAAAWEGGAGQSVPLGVGQIAHFVLQIVHTANFPAASCKPVTVSSLRVFLPNQSQAMFLSSDVLSFSLCSAGPSNLMVRAVTTGTGFPG